MLRRRLVVSLLALAGLGLVLVPPALAGNAGFAPPDSATQGGGDINELYWLLIGITGAVFILVEAALVWFLLRFRRRPGTPYEEEGPQIHGNTRLEVLWTVVPALILIAIVVVTIVKVPSVEASPGADEDPLVVEVDAHQFYWEYRYSNGVVSVDHLRVPAGRPVQLVLRSTDVAHSWWVPALTGKRDAIPGRANRLNFTAVRTGVFRGQCAEFCGIQHAVMRTSVEVLPAADFDAWAAAEAQAQEAGTSDLGEQTWAGACAKCHGLDGSGDVGPQIAGNPQLTDEQGLAQLLAEGKNSDQVPGYMPPVSTGWPDRQFQALFAYLNESLSQAPATQGG